MPWTQCFPAPLPPRLHGSLTDKCGPGNHPDESRPHHHPRPLTELYLGSRARRPCCVSDVSREQARQVQGLWGFLPSSHSVRPRVEKLLSQKATTQPTGACGDCHAGQHLLAEVLLPSSEVGARKVKQLAPGHACKNS